MRKSNFWFVIALILVLAIIFTLAYQNHLRGLEETIKIPKIPGVYLPLNSSYGIIVLDLNNPSQLNLFSQIHKQLEESK